jgi:hypothetical protein
VADHQQYLAARCATGDNICMYQQVSQSTAESINNGNLSVRERIAVDPVNAQNDYLYAFKKSPFVKGDWVVA